MDIQLEDLPLEALEAIIQKKKMEKLDNIELRTNEDLIKQFLDSKDSDKTKETYEYCLNHFIEYIEGKNLQKVTKMDLEKYYNYLNSSDYKKQTKQLKYTAVVSFYQYFIHIQDIDKQNENKIHFIEDPVSNINRSWKKDQEPSHKETLTNKEITKVLTELKKLNYRDYLIFYILADTSMRIGGLTNIKIKNIHFDKRIIETIDKFKWCKYVFGENLKRELEYYLNSIRKNINSKYSDSEYLFISRKKDKLSSSSISGHIFPKISKIIKQLTGKKITAHDLRRSFKTNRTNLGQNRDQVGSLMNHKFGLGGKYDRPTDQMLLERFDKYEEL